MTTMMMMTRTRATTIPAATPAVGSPTAVSVGNGMISFVEASKKSTDKHLL